MRRARLLSTLVLVMFAMTLGPGVVLADDPPPGAVRAYEPVTGPPPGYRVDQPAPGAVVKRVPARREGLSLQYLPAEDYRSGWTDCWRDWHFPLDFGHIGDHTSKSDLVEDQIVVDGFMRFTDEGWDDSCPCDTTGTLCHCNTSKTYHLTYHFYVESHHFFHKEGYENDYFETGDSM